MLWLFAHCGGPLRDLFFFPSPSFPRPKPRDTNPIVRPVREKIPVRGVPRSGSAGERLRRPPFARKARQAAARGAGQFEPPRAIARGADSHDHRRVEELPGRALCPAAAY